MYEVPGQLRSGASPVAKLDNIYGVSEAREDPVRFARDNSELAENERSEPVGLSRDGVNRAERTEEILDNIDATASGATIVAERNPLQIHL